MICSFCGGTVIWMGAFSNLTHTECLSCGQVNCQEPEESTEDDVSERDAMRGDYLRDELRDRAFDERGGQ